jgi:hypothetical protein
LHDISKYISNKYISNTYEKQNLILATETFVCNYRDHPFPVVLDQVCTHCSRDSSGFGAVAGQYGLSAPSKDFLLGSGLEADHSRTLRCFLRSHSLVALAVCHTGRPSHDPTSMFLLRERGCWPHPPSPQYGAVVMSPLQKSIPKE